MVVLGGTGWSLALKSIPTSFVAQLSIFKFFFFFYELHHLLIEVHLGHLLAVHIDLQVVIFFFDIVSGSQMKLFPKFCC